ncbi:Solute carrier family 35 member F4, partial [Varanus komodoensis]
MLELAGRLQGKAQENSQWLSKLRNVPVNDSCDSHNQSGCGSVGLQHPSAMPTEPDGGGSPVLEGAGRRKATAGRTGEDACEMLRHADKENSIWAKIAIAWRRSEDAFWPDGHAPGALRPSFSRRRKEKARSHVFPGGFLILKISCKTFYELKCPLKPSLPLCHGTCQTPQKGQWEELTKIGTRVTRFWISCTCASRSSVVRCKPGTTWPRRQQSPLPAAEVSAAPILELQSQSPAGFCRHGRGERQNRSGEEGTQAHAESTSQESRAQTRCESCLSVFLKIVWGFLIILSVSSSCVGTTQIVKITYKNFDYPFFMTWFSTNWNIMFFPVYYSGHLATAQEKQSPIKKFRECSRIFGEDGLTLKLFLKRTAPFSILWTLTNYLYLLALKKLTATDVSALFCCNKAFVFLLSWIVLKDRFMGIRIVAAIMAITGIVMMAYADGFHGDSIIGVAYAVGSASTSALYK